MDVNKLHEVARTAPPGQAVFAMLRAAVDELVAELHKELEAQGHKMTGNLVSTTEKEIVRRGNELLGSAILQDYITALNDGVPPDRIPYSLEWTGTDHSEYIEGLRRFWVHRGLSSDEALRASFATARKHKIEGMPTNNSRGFSSTGDRTGAIDNTIDKLDLNASFSQALDMYLESLINAMNNG